MSPFEFIFALFGLMLGFSLVEILGGLARTLEARLRVAPGATPVRIGWLTPMLGIFVLLDLLSFWMAAWVVRDMVTLHPATLLATTAFTGAYYLAAYLIFPRDPAAHADLDRHYFRVRRIVLGAMLVLMAAQLCYYMSQPALAGLLARPLALAMTALLAALIVAAMAVRGVRASAIVLALLIARYLVIYLL